MAERKKNIHSSTQIDVLKKELRGVIEYLENIVFEKIADRIGWKLTAKGGTMPTIISTQERIIKTIVSEIKRSASIITAVFESEGMDENLEYQVKITVDKLKELQDFYYGQNINDITDREIEISAGKNKNGTDKIIKAIAATEEDQRMARGQITETVTKIIPLVDVIKSYKTTVVRGGAEATPAMIRFEKKRNTINTDE